MKRRARFVIEVDIVDLDKETRQDLIEDQEMMNDEGDLGDYPVFVPTLSNYIEDGENLPAEVGWLVTGWLEPELCAEMFAGSNIYVSLAQGHLVSSEWVGELTD